MGPDVYTDLKGLVLRCGSQQAAAKHLGISPQYLCDVIAGRRAVSKRLAAALGYRLAYVPVGGKGFPVAGQ